MGILRNMEDPEVKKLIRMSVGLADRVAAYRFDTRVKFENAAIVKLIEAGLEAIEKAKVSAG